MLKRKDYEVISQTIRYTQLSKQARANVARELAGAFADDNPQFDSERFIAACSHKIKGERTRRVPVESA